MSCLNPTMAWQDLSVTTKTGKHPVIFSYNELDPQYFRWRYDDAKGSTVFHSNRYRPLDLPCGKCLLCRKARSWEIAVRAWCEFKSDPWRPCCFVTLTCDDAHLPDVFPGGLLRHRPWQLFAKRVRKKYGSFRFLMCGEYGEHTHRPHYHAVIYGIDFTHRVLEDHGYCDSPELRELWQNGQIMCRRVEVNSIMYVAGYQLKLATADVDVDEVDDDEVKLGSYVRWSRRPGLGLAFLEKYPSLFQQRIGRFKDGEPFKTVSPSIILNGNECHFDGRFFKDKLACIDRDKYDIMQSLNESRILREQEHNPSCDKMIRSTRALMNRDQLIRLNLAKRSRDVVDA